MNNKLKVLLLISGICLNVLFADAQGRKQGTVCDSLDISFAEHLVDATLWYQKSAEKRALYYQSYNYARTTLDQQLKKLKKKDKKAVILDIDETVLDNSPYQGKLIKDGMSYTPKSWKAWTDSAIAKALPGAVDFTSYAKSRGVEVFYVSNRDDDEKMATIKNLNAEKFPYADERHVLCRLNGVSNKTPRYDSIAKTYYILLFVGDNLRDFDELFGKRGNDYGFENVDRIKDQFGERFIILPNPMYGDWEKTITGGPGTPETIKNTRRKEALQSF